MATAVPRVRGAEARRRGLAAHQERHGEGGMEPALLGLLVFVASEVMFFAGLFGAYFTFRGAAPVWPPPGPHGPFERLPVPYAVGLTVILVTSSVTMQLAVLAIRYDKRLLSNIFIGVTLLLGLVFIAGQANEWNRLEFSIKDGIYPSLFYTITGFHGLHVLGGVVALMFLMAKAVKGAFSAENHVMMESVSFYWHFVDVIWVVVFASLYLLQTSGAHQ